MPRMSSIAEKHSTIECHTYSTTIIASLVMTDKSGHVTA